MVSAFVNVLVQNIHCDDCVIPEICEAWLCLNGHCAACLIQDGYTGFHQVIQDGYTSYDICAA
jgi:hypothetical protein